MLGVVVGDPLQGSVFEQHYFLLCALKLPHIDPSYYNHCSYTLIVCILGPIINMYNSRSVKQQQTNQQVHQLNDLNKWGGKGIPWQVILYTHSAVHTTFVSNATGRNAKCIFNDS